MLRAFTDKMQTIAVDTNPTLIIAISEKNKVVIVEQSFNIVLTRESSRGLFSVSAGAYNIVTKIDIRHTAATNSISKV